MGSPLDLVLQLPPEAWVTGIGFLAVLTAAERFVRSRREEQGAMKERLDEIIRRLDSLEQK